MKFPRHPFAGLVLAALLAACQAPPHHPPPAPAIRTQAPPPPAAAPASETTADSASPTAADTNGDYAAPSPYAADVEFEEVPVDATGPASPAPAAAAPGDTGPRDSGGGGGAQLPLARMNDDIAARERAQAPAAGALPGATTGLVGPRLELGSGTTVSAPGGSITGAQDGRGQASVRPAHAGAGGAAASGSGLGATPDRSGDGSRAQPLPAADGAPPDFSHAADDDIVARQLREAAEGERDPELAARLWDEYRRYKAGL